MNAESGIDVDSKTTVNINTLSLPLKVTMHRILEGKKFTLTPYTKGDDIYVFCEDTGLYMQHTIDEILDHEIVPMKEVHASELPSHECEVQPDETLFIGTKYHTVRSLFFNEKTQEEIMELTDLETGDEICFACPLVARRFYFKSYGLKPPPVLSPDPEPCSTTEPQSSKQHEQPGSKAFIFVVFEKEGQIFIEEGIREEEYGNGLRASYEGIEGEIRGFVALTNGAVMHVHSKDGDYLLVAYPLSTYPAA